MITVGIKAKTALVLVGVWVLLSGILEPWLLALGVASSLLVAWVAMRADRSDGEPISFGLRIERLPGYLFRLAWEIVKSNIEVSRRILAPSLPIAPAVRWLPARQHCEFTRMIYANSITLTPGTLSIDLTDGWVEVHALSEDTLDELARGEMEAWVRQLDLESGH